MLTARAVRGGWLPTSAAAAVLMTAVSTQSGIVTTVTPNTVPTLLTSTVPGATILTFDSDAVGNQPAGFTPATGSIPGGGVVASGGDISIYAPPLVDSTQFYAVAYNPTTGNPVAPASDLFTAPAGVPQNYFGLYCASIYTYNNITFELNGVPIAGGNFTGADFPPANGDQTAADTNEYVEFLFTEGLTYNQVLFNTSAVNFEFDNMAFGST